MHIGALFQQFDNLAQGKLDFRVFRSQRGGAYDIDGGGELVVHPVIQLAQKHPFLAISKAH